jgi:molybdopterin synthase catalytic subunit
MDVWLREAKASPEAERCGMFLTHCGVVRRTAKAQARFGEEGAAPVRGMRFGYDADKAAAAVEATKELTGIHYVRIWLNEGELEVGDDIMFVLIGGDIRPHVVDALLFLVGKLKNECVSEIELSEG